MGLITLSTHHFDKMLAAARPDAAGKATYHSYRAPFSHFPSLRRLRFSS
jgi:hypothetical protein